MQDGKREYQRSTIQLEQANYVLRKEKEQHEAGWREAETGEDAESVTGTDGEDPSQKRKRGEE
ncbi:hypothetical protein ACEPPN_000727 [Leptodophora sp. 'Broadleaf-Isolate-01']